MPIPPFIVDLRRKVGTDPLWLTGVTAVVFDEQGRILLTHRADTHRWAHVSGILEPGEAPAPAVVREVREETGVEIAVDGLAAVRVGPPMSYPNGDRAQYLDLLFAAHAVGGLARVSDDESLAVGWHSPEALPEGTGHQTEERLADVRTFLADPGAGTRFDQPRPSGPGDSP